VITNSPSKERYDVEKEIIDHMKKVLADIERKSFKRYINSSTGEKDETDNKTSVDSVLGDARDR